ncbi:UNVERIFIED_CONTAM: hypothetical protein FKN15_041576 [Acipenser sinensis]
MPKTVKTIWSLLDDDFFSKLAEEAGKDEGSDISEADPLALLDSMKDIDDMDADLFGSKKPSSAPSRSLSGGLKQQEKPKAALSDDDDGDILGPSPGSKEEEDLLDDQDEGKDSKHWAPQRKDNLAPSEAPGTKQEETAPPASAPTRPAAVLRKREELSFDEDGDELMEALGFGESPKGRRRAEDATPQPARSRLDEILGRGTAPRLLERPLTGESKEVQQEKRSHRNQTDAVVGEEDFTFGAYQPTVASTPEGRQSRRQSVRFSTEDISGLSPEKKLKPATPATPLSARSSKPAADWLGLKEEEAADWRSPSPVRDSLRPPPSPDVPAPQIPSPSNKPPGSSRPPSGSKVTDTPLPASGRTPHSGPRLEASVSTEEDDWLAGALSRKRQQEKGVGSWDLDETDAPVSSSLPWENPQRQATPPPPSGTRREDPPRTVPAQRLVETNTPVLQPQLVQSQARGLGPLTPRDLESRLGVLQKQLRECETEQQAGEQALQTRLTQMECQVRKLELERDQAQLLLDTLTQRQRQDLELVESTHRTRVKLLEEASQQREAHLRQESEELQERVAALVRSAERDRVDLVTQHQRRLGEAQQERDREVERLRELQRQSILEMKKDHEEQLQRLKRLKDQEIDAVTSATSQTRSLNGVIDQMESFSRKLGDLSYKVESTHEQTAQGLEQGARQRDDQLRVLQDRLSQQQRDMEDERSRLQSVITKMESRLSEQQRLLEKVRKLELERDQAQLLLDTLTQRQRQDLELVESTHRTRVKLLEEASQQREAHLRQESEELQERVAALVRSAERDRVDLVTQHQRRLVLQDRLSQQQRDMEDERSRLQSVVTKMESRLSEQQRLLEKERWRLTAEQSKVESLQRALEEERRVLTQQISMEREELERAKSALLEEQQAVMQRCAEERRKLAAEWTEFHKQEKQRQERTEREASRALERDSHREGSLINLAQADIKVKAGELKLREEALIREREAQERERQELQLEKERVNGAALRLRQRAEEMDSVSKLASQKYEEGEHALLEAKQVASEHQARLRSIHQQMERLRQQEQHLHQVTQH